MATDSFVACRQGLLFCIWKYVGDIG